MEFPALFSRSESANADRPLRAPRVPRRRRWWLLCVAAALVVTGGASSYVLLTATDPRAEVLVAAREIPVGTTVTDADLTMALVATDGPARTTPASAKAGIVGQTAAATIPAGTFINPGQLREQGVPRPGELVVALRSEPGTLPRDLRAGELVRVVPVTDSPTGLADDPAAATFDARVLGIGGADSQGAVTVDVLVSDDVADRASSAAAGRVVPLLLGPDR